MPPPHKPDFLVDLAVSEENLRVIWKEGGVHYIPSPRPFLPYTIHRGSVEDLADRLRATLEELVENSLSSEKPINRGNREQFARRRDEILRTLAQHGNDLYSILFAPADGSIPKKEHIDKKILPAIENSGEPLSICFLVPTKVSVPWGLLCDHATYRAVKSGAEVTPDTFWGMRHRISTVFGQASPKEFTATYEHETFTMIWGADQQEFGRLRKGLSQYADDENALNALLSHYGEPVFSSAALESAWAEQESRLGLMYILAHSDKRTISFSDNDEMDVLRFRIWATKKTASPPRCLVFLNGCSTTGMHERGTFLEATGRDGFCGYIGAEAVVPKFFAFRFGIAFKMLFYSGLDVAEALATLQRRHWPLGLVYGLYGFPHVQIEPHPALSTMIGENGNFSEGPLTVVDADE